MKNKRYLIAFLLVFLISVFFYFISHEDNNKINDLIENNIKGNVKQITEIGYWTEEQLGQVITNQPDEMFSFVSSKYGSQKIRFNKNGFITERRGYPFENSNLEVYKYDDDLLIEKIIIREEGSDLYSIEGSAQITINKYNDLNQIIETKRFNSSPYFNSENFTWGTIALDTPFYKNIDSGVFYYNYIDGLARKKINTDYLLIAGEDYIYDSTGNNIKLINYNIDFERQYNPFINPNYKYRKHLFETKEYKYNKLNQLVQEKRTVLKDSTGRNSMFAEDIVSNRAVSIDCNEYDENGNKIIVQTGCDQDCECSGYTYNYKFTNKEITESTIINSDTKQIHSITKYKYNQFGDLIEEWFQKTDPETSYLRKFEYIYDEKNNWIQRTQIMKGKVNYISEREIEYFSE